MKKIVLFLGVVLFTLLACEKLYISDRHLKFGKDGGCQEVTVRAHLKRLQGATLTCTETYLIDERLDKWAYPDTCILKYQWLEVHQYFDKPLKVFVKENKTGEKRELSFHVGSGNLRNFIKVTQKGK